MSTSLDVASIFVNTQRNVGPAALSGHAELVLRQTYESLIKIPFTVGLNEQSLFYAYNPAIRNFVTFAPSKVGSAHQYLDVSRYVIRQLFDTQLLEKHNRVKTLCIGATYEDMKTFRSKTNIHFCLSFREAKDGSRNIPIHNHLLAKLEKHQDYFNILRKAGLMGARKVLADPHEVCQAFELIDPIYKGRLHLDEAEGAPYARMVARDCVYSLHKSHYAEKFAKSGAHELVGYAALPYSLLEEFRGDTGDKTEAFHAPIPGVTIAFEPGYFATHTHDAYSPDCDLTNPNPGPLVSLKDNLHLLACLMDRMRDAVGPNGMAVLKDIPTRLNCLLSAARDNISQISWQDHVSDNRCECPICRLHDEVLDAAKIYKLIEEGRRLAKSHVVVHTSPDADTVKHDADALAYNDALTDAKADFVKMRQRCSRFACGDWKIDTLRHQGFGKGCRMKNGVRATMYLHDGSIAYSHDVKSWGLLMRRAAFCGVYRGERYGFQVELGHNVFPMQIFKVTRVDKPCTIRRSVVIPPPLRVMLMLDTLTDCSAGKRAIWKMRYIIIPEYVYTSISLWLFAVSPDARTIQQIVAYGRKKCNAQAIADESGIAWKFDEHGDVFVLIRLAVALTAYVSLSDADMRAAIKYQQNTSQWIQKVKSFFATHCSFTTKACRLIASIFGAKRGMQGLLFKRPGHTQIQEDDNIKDRSELTYNDVTAYSFHTAFGAKYLQTGFKADKSIIDMGNDKPEFSIDLDVGDIAKAADLLLEAAEQMEKDTENSQSDDCDPDQPALIDDEDEEDDGLEEEQDDDDASDAADDAQKPTEPEQTEQKPKPSLGKGAATGMLAGYVKDTVHSPVVGCEFCSLMDRRSVAAGLDKMTAGQSITHCSGSDESYQPSMEFLKPAREAMSLRYKQDAITQTKEGATALAKLIGDCAECIQQLALFGINQPPSYKGVNMMMKFFLIYGPPGSAKSTKARHMCAHFGPGNCVVAVPFRGIVGDYLNITYFNKTTGAEVSFDFGPRVSTLERGMLKLASADYLLIDESTAVNLDQFSMLLMRVKPKAVYLFYDDNQSGVRETHGKSIFAPCKDPEHPLWTGLDVLKMPRHQLNNNFRNPVIAVAILNGVPNTGHHHAYRMGTGRKPDGSQAPKEKAAAYAESYGAQIEVVDLNKANGKSLDIMPDSIKLYLAERTMVDHGVVDSKKALASAHNVKSAAGAQGMTVANVELHLSDADTAFSKPSSEYSLFKLANVLFSRHVHRLRVVYTGTFALWFLYEYLRIQDYTLEYAHKCLYKYTPDTITRQPVGAFPPAGTRGANACKNKPLVSYEMWKIGGCKIDPPGSDPVGVEMMLPKGVKPSKTEEQKAAELKSFVEPIYGDRILPCSAIKQVLDKQYPAVDHTPVDNPGAGDCLYYAIDKGMQPKELRLAMAKHVVANVQTMLTNPLFAAMAGDNRGALVKTFLPHTKMAHYGDVACIMALAHMYKARIIVYYFSNETTFHPQCISWGTYIKTLYIAHTGGTNGHFVRIDRQARKSPIKDTPADTNPHGAPGTSQCTVPTAQTSSAVLTEHPIETKGGSSPLERLLECELDRAPLPSAPPLGEFEPAELVDHNGVVFRCHSISALCGSEEKSVEELRWEHVARAAQAQSKNEHTGEDENGAFTCGICNRNYLTTDARDVHQETHSIEEAYAAFYPASDDFVPVNHQLIAPLSKDLTKAAKQVDAIITRWWKSDTNSTARKRSQSVHFSIADKLPSQFHVRALGVMARLCPIEWNDQVAVPVNLSVDALNRRSVYKPIEQRCPHVGRLKTAISLAQFIANCSKGSQLVILGASPGCVCSAVCEAALRSGLLSSVLLIDPADKCRVGWSHEKVSFLPYMADRALCTELGIRLSKNSGDIVVWSDIRMGRRDESEESKRMMDDNLMLQLHCIQALNATFACVKYNPHWEGVCLRPAGVEYLQAFQTANCHETRLWINKAGGIVHQDLTKRSELLQAYNETRDDAQDQLIANEAARAFIAACSKVKPSFRASDAMICKKDMAFSCIPPEQYVDYLRRRGGLKTACCKPSNPTCVRVYNNGDGDCATKALKQAIPGCSADLGMWPSTQVVVKAYAEAFSKIGKNFTIVDSMDAAASSAYAGTDACVFIRDIQHSGRCHISLVDYFEKPDQPKVGGFTERLDKAGQFSRFDAHRNIKSAYEYRQAKLETGEWTWNGSERLLDNVAARSLYTVPVCEDPELEKPKLSIPVYHPEFDAYRNHEDVVGIKGPDVVAATNIPGGIKITRPAREYKVRLDTDCLTHSLTRGGNLKSPAVTVHRNNVSAGNRFTTLHPQMVLKSLYQRYASIKPAPPTHLGSAEHLRVRAEMLARYQKTKCVDKLKEATPVIFGEANVECVTRKVLQAACQKGYVTRAEASEMHENDLVEWSKTHFTIKDGFKPSNVTKDNYGPPDPNKAAQGICAMNIFPLIKGLIVCRLMSQLNRACNRNDSLLSVLMDDEMSMEEFMSKVVRTHEAKFPSTAEGPTMTYFTIGDAIEADASLDDAMKIAFLGAYEGDLCHLAWLTQFLPGAFAVAFRAEIRAIAPYEIRIVAGEARVYAVHNKNTSGHLLTLEFNTFACLCVFLMKLDPVQFFSTPIILLCKGDDTCSESLSTLRVDPAGSLMIGRYTALKTKVFVSKWGEFCGMALAGWLIPSIVRMAVKALGHQCRDWEHFTKYKLSLEALLNDIAALGEHTVVSANAWLYGVTAECMQSVLDVVKSISHISEEQWLDSYEHMRVHRKLWTKEGLDSDLMDYMLERVRMEEVTYSVQSAKMAQFVNERYPRELAENNVKVVYDANHGNKIFLNYDPQEVHDREVVKIKPGTMPNSNLVVGQEASDASSDARVKFVETMGCKVPGWDALKPMRSHREARRMHVSAFVRMNSNRWRFKLLTTPEPVGKQVIMAAANEEEKMGLVGGLDGLSTHDSKDKDVINKQPTPPMEFQKQAILSAANGVSFRDLHDCCFVGEVEFNQILVQLLTSKQLVIRDNLVFRCDQTPALIAAVSPVELASMISYHSATEGGPVGALNAVFRKLATRGWQVPAYSQRNIGDKYQPRHEATLRVWYGDDRLRSKTFIQIDPNSQVAKSSVHAHALAWLLNPDAAKSQREAFETVVSKLSDKHRRALMQAYDGSSNAGKDALFELATSSVIARAGRKAPNVNLRRPSHADVRTSSITAPRVGFPVFLEDMTGVCTATAIYAAVQGDQRAKLPGIPECNGTTADDFKVYGCRGERFPFKTGMDITLVMLAEKDGVVQDRTAAAKTLPVVEQSCALSVWLVANTTLGNRENMLCTTGMVKAGVDGLLFEPVGDTSLALKAVASWIRQVDFKPFGTKCKLSDIAIALASPANDFKGHAKASGFWIADAVSADAIVAKASAEGPKTVVLARHKRNCNCKMCNAVKSVKRTPQYQARQMVRQRAEPVAKAADEVVPTAIIPQQPQKRTISPSELQVVSQYMATLLDPVQFFGMIPDPSTVQIVPKRVQTIHSSTVPADGQGQFIITGDGVHNVVGYEVRTDPPRLIPIFRSQTLSDQYEGDRMVSQLLELTSDTVSVTEAALSGTISAVVVHSTPGDAVTVSYADMPGISADPDECVANVPIHRGITYMYLPNNFSLPFTMYDRTIGYSLNGGMTLGRTITDTEPLDLPPKRSTAGRGYQYDAEVTNPAFTLAQNGGLQSAGSVTMDVDGACDFTAYGMLTITNTSDAPLNAAVNVGVTMTLTTIAGDTPGKPISVMARTILPATQNVPNLTTRAIMEFPFSFDYIQQQFNDHYAAFQTADGKFPYLPIASATFEVLMQTSAGATPPGPYAVDLEVHTVFNGAMDPAMASPTVVMAYRNATPGTQITLNGITNFEAMPAASLRKEVALQYTCNNPGELDYVKSVLSRKSAYGIRMVQTSDDYRRHKSMYRQLYEVSGPSTAHAGVWANVLDGLKKYALPALREYVPGASTILDGARDLFSDAKAARKIKMLK